MPTPIRDLIFHRDDKKDSPMSDLKNPAAAEKSLAMVTPSAADNKNVSTMNLRSARAWNVRMPPVKKHMVAGHLVPNVRQAIGIFQQKRRHIRIEVRGPVSSSSSPDHVDELTTNDVVLLRVFRNNSQNHDNNDHSSVTSEGDDHSLAETLPAFGVEQGDPNMKEHGRYKLEDIGILKTAGKVVELRLGHGNETVVRDIKFESADDALSFQQLLEHMHQLERDRTQKQVALYKDKLRSTPPTSPSGSKQVVGLEDNVSSINLLVEIVSASNLPVADMFTSDAYVVVHMGGNEIHRTKVISSDVDPIWTLDKGSLFLLQMSPEQFFSSTGGMSFVVKDFDSLGSNELLGNVTLPLDKLLEGTGERTEFVLETNSKFSKTSKMSSESMLCLRFKKASQSDIDFMKDFKHNEDKRGIYINETYLPVRAPYSKVLKGQVKRGKDHKDLFRVKPFPDATREEETKWMTEEQIEAESIKPSTHWVEAGSGGLGKGM
jgi:hypothetical protein